MGWMSGIEFIKLVKRVFFIRLSKNAQMQGARGAFHLPARQAMLRSEAYLDVRCNGEA